MDKHSTLIEAVRAEIHLSLDELARRGAQRMLEVALQAEVDEYVGRHIHDRDEAGHALVVRNGRAQERTVQCGAGQLKLRAPRVADRRLGAKFTSQILPPYLRKSPRLEEAVPVLYLRGLSTGDFSEALSVLLGEEAIAGFSPTTVNRLLTVWQDEYRAWRKRPLDQTAYLYIWADGVYFNVRLGDDRLAALVILGVRPDGRKEVIALEDGYRESSESWKSVLQELKRRGMPTPQLAIADGALGFWAALRQVYPEAQEQRCWVHKIANILDKLPKRLQPRVKSQLHEIMRAPDRASALAELVRFGTEYAAKYPKAVECLTKDQETLLTFMDYPAAHWIHLRSTNAIESTFATVKARTRTTKGAGSRDAGLAMAFKLLTRAEKRWRRVNAPHLMPLVAAGVKFPDGKTRILPDWPSDSIVNLPLDATAQLAIHNI
jgi:transposase-like protein